MYCILLNLGRGGIEIFFIPPPLTPKKSLGGGIKNDVTEIIHLLTFQSINNVLYFFLKFGGYRNIFYFYGFYPCKARDSASIF